jgi:hypothetical protein
VRLPFVTLLCVPATLAERERLSPSIKRGRMMQAMFAKDQEDRAASLVPEWPSVVEARSLGFENNHRVTSRPSIVRRMLRSLARFSIAVLIGVGATLAWQFYGDEAREVLSTQVPSLSWLSVSTMTLAPDRQGSTQNAAVPQAVPIHQTAAPAAAAATTPESAQLEPIARDLAAMRRSLEQLAVTQEQMAQNIAALQAAEQDIKKKMASQPSAQTISAQPRKPPKPPANSAPAQSPPVPPPQPVAQ